MEFGSAVVVRISSTNDAATTGATGACRQEKSIELETSFRKAVDMRGLDIWISVAAKVGPTDVITNDQNNIGAKALPWQTLGIGPGE